MVLEDPSAADAVHAALAAASAVGDGRLAAGLRVHAAQLARMEGDRAAAATLLRENQEWFAAHGGGDRAALTHVLLGALQDDEDTLTGLLDSELDPASRQATLDALGRLASRTGQPEKAAELWAAADSVEVPAPDVILRSDRSLAP